MTDGPTQRSGKGQGSDQGSDDTTVMPRTVKKGVASRSKQAVKKAAAAAKKTPAPVTAPVVKKAATPPPTAAKKAAAPVAPVVKKVATPPPAAAAAKKAPGPVTAPVRPGGGADASAAARSGRGGPRRARLHLTRIDPWSAMKMSFLLSIALGIVAIVSMLVLWGLLGAAGVWDSINSSVNSVIGNGSSWDITKYLSTTRVIGFTMIVAVVDVVLFTVIGTLSAFLYNMAAALLGGLELTLAEEQQ